MVRGHQFIHIHVRTNECWGAIKNKSIGVHAARIMQEVYIYPVDMYRTKWCPLSMSYLLHLVHKST